VIRSAAHVWWEAAMERGARDAELRAMAEFIRPFTDAARQAGIAFSEAAARMSRFMDAYKRGMQNFKWPTTTTTPGAQS
jgi:hypothetical protein